jgi:excinuclease ABC subunit C
VPGLGEHRRKALVTHFGSVARLKSASVDEITAVRGIGLATAKAVLEALGVTPESDPASAPSEDDQLTVSPMTDGAI